jgi:aconitate decarboxylase
MTSYTRQVADIATSLKLSDVPLDVVLRAKALILDGLGCALFSADLKWTNILAGVVDRLEPKGGTASIWGRRAKASATNAALVNGAMIQGFELDDAHIGAALHSCSIVLPAAFAAAEMIGADKVDGAKLLLAIIAGLEFGPRVGICMRGEQMSNNGWHSGAIVAPFPAAIAAGIMLGLNSDQMYHALGIAGTQAGGLMAVQYGSMVKRIQHGKGAQSGLYGALLAVDGFTGIEDIFEEKYGGFCTTFSHSTDQFDLSALVDNFGTTWELMRCSIKFYAAKMNNHATINAIEELINEEGLRAEDVEAIQVAVVQSVVKQCGWSPYVPKGETAAQLHMGFCIAMRLIEGEVFVDQMVEENIARPDLVALANRVTVVRSVAREQKGTNYRYGSDVEVTLKSGSVLKKTVDFPAGSNLRPPTAEQMERKFRRLASETLPPKKIAKIEKIVWGLDRETAVTPLIKLMQGR